MFERMKKINQKINLDDLNIIVLIVSILLYIVSLLFSKNILIIVFLFFLNFELFIHLKRNKYLTFLNAILPIIIFAYLLLSNLKLNLPFDYLMIYRIIIKTLLIIDYVILVINIIKKRKIKYVRGSKRKHTFNELRKRMIKKVHQDNLNYIEDYIIDNDIDKKSDYYKVISKNIKLKTIDDVEEYVTLNYLRFYKNKKYNRRNIFDKLNLAFLGIHVIILMLVFLLR